MPAGPSLRRRLGGRRLRPGELRPERPAAVDRWMANPTRRGLEVRPESHWRPSADPLALQLASSIDALEEPHPRRRGRFPAELLASPPRAPASSAARTRCWPRPEASASHRLLPARAIPNLRMYRRGQRTWFPLRSVSSASQLPSAAQVDLPGWQDRMPGQQPRPARWTTGKPVAEPAAPVAPRDSRGRCYERVVRLTRGRVPKFGAASRGKRLSSLSRASCVADTDSGPLSPRSSGHTRGNQ